MRRQHLDSVAALVDVPGPDGAHHAAVGHDLAFPFLVEDRANIDGIDRAEAVHPAHVMNAVHA